MLGELGDGAAAVGLHQVCLGLAPPSELAARTSNVRSSVVSASASTFWAALSSCGRSTKCEQEEGRPSGVNRAPVRSDAWPS